MLVEKAHLFNLKNSKKYFLIRQNIQNTMHRIKKNKTKICCMLYLEQNTKLNTLPVKN